MLLKDTCDIKVRNDEGEWIREAVPSKNYGLLCVHKDTAGRYWTISHAPTGGRIWGGLAFAKATKIAKDLSKREDWGLPEVVEGPNDNNRETWRRLYDSLRDCLREHGVRCV